MDATQLTTTSNYRTTAAPTIPSAYPVGAARLDASRLDTAPGAGGLADIAGAAARLDRLAHRIAADGLAAHETAVVRIAAAGHEAGVHPAVIETLVDRSVAEVMRLRAFARVMAAIS